MPVQPKPPPSIESPGAPGRRPNAPIADVRDQFKRTKPQTAEDERRARAFIDGKIEMIRRDPDMSDAEKAAAIRDLEAQR